MRISWRQRIENYDVIESVRSSQNCCNISGHDLVRMYSAR